MRGSVFSGKIKQKVRTVLVRGILLLCGIALASCSLLPSGLLPNSAGSDDQGSESLRIPVVRGSIASTVSFVGNVQYSQSTSLTWKTAGVIDEVFAEVGDTVHRGDVLAVLAVDSLPYSVLIAEKTMIEQQENLEDISQSQSGQMQAYVTLNSKESALLQAKLAQEALYYPRATRAEMERAWDSLALANLNFNYAKQDYDHIMEANTPWEGYEEEVRINMFGRSILISGADSRSGRERKFEDYVSAYNTLVSAYETYLWTVGEPTSTDYAVAEGNVQVAQMEYDQALEDYLSYGTMPREKDLHAAEVVLRNAETVFNQRYIIALFDGTVTSVDAVAGYYVARGASAIRVDDMSRIFIPIDIPELDVSSIAVGMPVEITLDAVEGKTYSGHIIGIDEASDSTGNTAYFSAMIEMDDPDGKILAGMTAEVKLSLQQKHDVLLIPTAAITYIDGVPYVTVAEETGNRKIEIRTGIISDNIAEVTSGELREDALLVVSSVSADVLTRLGLDPVSYLSSGAGSRQSYGAESGFERPAAPQMTAEPTAVNTPVPTSSVPAEVPDETETVTEVVTEVPSETDVPGEFLWDEGGFPGFPGEPGEWPEGGGSGFFPGPADGTGSGRGGGRGLRETVSPSASPTVTVDPAGSGEKG